MNHPRPSVHGEEGWALVTAVAMMAIMLVIGLATMANVDFNQQQTREQRELESSLNLTEGVLYAQSFTLARKWPVAAGVNYPTTCSSSGPTGRTTALADDFMRCPNKDNLSSSNSSTPAAAAFTAVDFKANTTWTTRVRDNYGVLAGTYIPASADAQLTGSAGICNTPPAPCARDFNNDKTMWVEARAVVRGKSRKIVALMRLEQIQEAVPVVGITAGALALTNNGNHGNTPIYDVTGASAIVRCTPDANEGSGATCTNYKSTDHTMPTPPVKGDAPNFMTPEMIKRFKARAITDNTYFKNCSETNTLAGDVVFIEYCPADGSDPGKTYTPGGGVCAPSPQTAPSRMVNSCTNSINRPGLVIVRCGGLRLSGGTYVGVLYFVNGSDRNGNQCQNDDDTTVVTGTDRGIAANPSCPKNAQKDPDKVVLDVQDTAGVWGAVAADGGACVQLGSNGMQVKFDRNVFGAVSSYGTVGLVQNTWRELPPGAN